MVKKTYDRQQAEDAAAKSGDSGTPILVVQKTTGAALAGDGDYTNPQVDGSGNLRVNLAAGGSADSVVVDDAAFTPGTTSVTMAGATFDDTTPDSVDEGDGGALRMSAARELYTQIRDGAGNERALNIDANGEIGVTLANAALPDTGSSDLAALNTATTDIPNVIGTDGSAGPSKALSIGGTDGSGNLQEVTTDTDGHLQVDVLSGASATEYTEDDVAPSNPVGPTLLAERDDALGGLTPAEGDWTHLFTDANGALWVIPSGTVTVQEATALDVSAATVTVDLGSNNDVQGAVAEGAAVGSNPFLIAGDDGTNVKHIAVAADGAVHVDDGGNSLTVDGTVTANLSATDNAVLDAIDTNTDIPTGVDDAEDVALNNGSETSLGAAPAGTHYRMIKSDSANTVDVRIGKTGQVDGTRGFVLEPGDAMGWPGTATVYAFAGAASQVVNQSFVVA